MESIKIFTKSNCPRCVALKDIAQELMKEGLKVVNYDLDTVEGLSEAAYYSILSTPSIVIEDESENEIASWRGVLPSIQELKEVLLERRRC